MSIMRLSRPCIYLACTLLALLSAVLRAQAPDSSIKIGPDATPKLPADACFYATVHVKEIVAMKELQLVPWEIITAAGLDQMGFDPLAVERIDLILALGEESRPQIAFVARTNQRLRSSQKRPRISWTNRATSSFRSMSDLLWLVTSSSQARCQRSSRRR